jgi:hypothetical protein
MSERHGRQSSEDARRSGEGEPAPQEERQCREQHAGDDGELRAGDRHGPDLDLDHDRNCHHGRIERVTHDEARKPHASKVTRFAPSRINRHDDLASDLGLTSAREDHSPGPARIGAAADDFLSDSP